MLIFVCLSLFVLFAAIGLAVDLGYAYSIRITAQTAADSAAQAAAIYANLNGFTCGAGGVTCNSTYGCANPPVTPPVTALEAGCLYAKANGFLNTGNQTVTLIANNTTPPNETGNASPALWIQASVTQTVTNSFLYWAGFHGGNVTSQAIAGVVVTPASSCIYVLDNGNTAGALNASGSASLTASSCDIWINSSSGSALTESGSAALSAAQIEVHGSTNISGSATATPTPTTGAAVIADPLAGLPAPAVSTTCLATSYSISGTSTGSPGPGVYCGGMTMSGSAVVNLTTNGVYILNGGGLNISGSVHLTGTNVMFFLTGQHGYTNAPMNLSGSAVISLTAPSTGSYRGVLFYQDRSSTYASSNTISGSVPISGSGTFYFPSTKLNLSGSMSAGSFALVVWDLTVSGSATLDQDATGNLTGLAKSGSAIIE
jgi:hypothetical protein